jgi:hypothetical protein
MCADNWHKITRKQGSPHGKKGSKEDDTHSAHKLSYEVVNTIQQLALHNGVPPEDHATVCYFLDAAPNLRIKSARGNQSTDRQLDAVLIDALTSNGIIRTRRAADRAFQAFKGACFLTEAGFPIFATYIGNLQVQVNTRSGPLQYDLQDHELTLKTEAAERSIQNLSWSWECDFLEILAERLEYDD